MASYGIGRGLAGSILALPLGLASAAAIETDLPPERQKVLMHVLTQECGSCHGLSMRGGLGSPLRPENLEGRPDSAFQAIILHGIGGTPMPAWRPILSEADAAWMVKVLRAGVIE